MSQLDRDLEAVKAELSGLAADLRPALAVQWDKAPAPMTPAWDTKERATVVAPDDPTADTALDGRRLRVRGEAIRSVRLLRTLLIVLPQLRADLRSAVDAWHGDAREESSRP